MCGFCNLFGFGSRRNSRGCDSDYSGSSRRNEPRMNTYCASGIGTASDMPCGCDNDRDSYQNNRSGRNGCGCDCD